MKYADRRPNDATACGCTKATSGIRFQLGCGEVGRGLGRIVALLSV
jgi:hypothetical protein